MTETSPTAVQTSQEPLLAQTVKWPTQHQSHLTLPGAAMKLHYTTSSRTESRIGFLQSTHYILLPLTLKDKLQNEKDFMPSPRYLHCFQHRCSSAAQTLQPLLLVHAARSPSFKVEQRYPGQFQQPARIQKSLQVYTVFIVRQSLVQLDKVQFWSLKFIPMVSLCILG